MKIKLSIILLCVVTITAQAGTACLDYDPSLNGIAGWCSKSKKGKNGVPVPSPYNVIYCSARINASIAKSNTDNPKSDYHDDGHLCGTYDNGKDCGALATVAKGDPCPK